MEENNLNRENKEFEEKVEGIHTEKEDRCNGCQFLRFIDDPDPTDYFRDTDEMALCELFKAVIACSLNPWEVSRVSKPIFCPKISIELTEKEKGLAKRFLKSAKERYKERIREEDDKK